MPCAVRFFQRACDLDSEPDGFVSPKRALRGFALDVFHHQIIRPDVVNLANMRMIERGNGVSFLLEIGPSGRPSAA